MGKPRIVARRDYEFTATDPYYTDLVYEIRNEWRMRANGDIEFRAGRRGTLTGTFDLDSPGWRYVANIRENADEAAFNRWVDLTLETRGVLLHGSAAG